jgi:hypothetical protein
MVVLINTYLDCFSRFTNLRSFTTDSASKLDVLWLDGDTLGMDSSKVGVFEKTNKVSLSRFLKSQDSRSLESEISLEVLSNFTNQTLERKLADQELSGLLVTSDLTKSDSSRTISVWFLDTTSGWCRFACSFGCELLSAKSETGLAMKSHSIECVQFTLVPFHQLIYEQFA